ncbi:hypothetical protein PNOK_0686300 [Pyrrhoderma noxium]|uniref:Uncharacterized protein n=1 Tax=Pyrrhoderma noxium TaxID=2282107 RepID=A0A286UB60_9AGAM|nr:hypothetical protein PNOK_0686300 [Pyrrhoderma noxium]
MPVPKKQTSPPTSQARTGLASGKDSSPARGQPPATRTATGETPSKEIECAEGDIKYVVKSGLYLLVSWL